MRAYWRELLSAEGRAAFDCVVANMPRGEGEVRIPTLEEREVGKLFSAILNDRPDFFWISTSCGIRTAHSPWLGHAGGVQMTLCMQSVYPAMGIPNIERKLHEVTAGIAGRAAGKSDEEKLRVILAFFAGHVIYELDLERNQNAAAAIVYGRAQCSGISRAFKYLADAVGLDSIVVTGTAEDGHGKWDSHAWNIVWLDRKSYQLDVTFFLGWGHNDTAMGKWVCRSDAEFAETHRAEMVTPRCPVSRTLAPTDPATGMPAADVKHVISMQGIRKLLPQTPRSFKVRFTYGGPEKGDRFTERVGEIVKEYAQERRIAGSYSISFDGVWTLELEVR